MRRHSAGTLNALKPKEPQPTRKTFKAYVPGYVHMDVECLPQMQDQDQRGCLFVAFDLDTGWVFVQIKANKNAASAKVFLNALYKACPMKISKLLTDHHEGFTDVLFAKTPYSDHKQWSDIHAHLFINAPP